MPYRYAIVLTVPCPTAKMVTVEVNLKEGDPEPEQHLDDGEHIERVLVPLSELHERLQSECCLLSPIQSTCEE